MKSWDILAPKLKKNENLIQIQFILFHTLVITSPANITDIVYADVWIFLYAASILNIQCEE